MNYGLPDAYIDNVPIQYVEYEVIMPPRTSPDLSPITVRFKLLNGQWLNVTTKNAEIDITDYGHKGYMRLYVG